MQLPSDPGALKHVYELTKNGPYKGKLGIRGNLDDEPAGAILTINLAELCETHNVFLS